MERCYEKMVLPVRIELTTSALPRMRSTTELRQHDHFDRPSPVEGGGGAGLWPQRAGLVKAACPKAEKIAI